MSLEMLKPSEHDITQLASQSLHALAMNRNVIGLVTKLQRPPLREDMDLPTMAEDEEGFLVTMPARNWLDKQDVVSLIQHGISYKYTPYR